MSLLTDIFNAYYDARRNKRNTHSQLEFELHLESNLVELYHEIKERRYKPSSSICFIINDPLKREVFASNFRDRVVHHLYYNYVSPIFERDFIYDSYSCRKGKGTLFGIERFEHHIRSCSHNFTKRAYVLKLDISGYFMSISRQRLRNEVLRVLGKYWNRKTPAGKKWREVLDVELIEYLTNVISLKNPLDNCRIKGAKSDWDDLPDSKCLWKSPEGVGLPIGDLTSQLFSNVFLNQLDTFVKRVLRFKHYGRYVDDFYIVGENKAELQNAIKPISDFLQSIGLRMHPKKILLQECTRKLPFLGAVSRPYCRFVSHRTVAKFNRRFREMEHFLEQSHTFEQQKNVMAEIHSTMNSYLGYFQHFNTSKYEADTLAGSCMLNYFSIKPSKTRLIAKIDVV